MCGLCGVLGGEDHWTDAAGNTAVFGDREIRQTRRQERLYRVALANRVLRHYGFKLGDWEGASYVLRTATGRTAIVDNLAALWPTAEELAGRRCDPLDAALLGALEAAA